FHSCDPLPPSRRPSRLSRPSSPSHPSRPSRRAALQQHCLYTCWRAPALPAGELLLCWSLQSWLPL
ncbi:unnamed protein product, partial [Closterium sp. NIES-54]